MTSGGKKARRRRERQEAARARARRARILTLIAISGVVGTVIAFLAFRQPPTELTAVETFPAQGRSHLAEGEAPPVYNSDPPTSGDHAASALSCGIYTQEIPDVLQVHNLEHGAVIIQYSPELPTEEIEALEDFARSKQSHIVVAPRAGIANPVVLTSWTRMLRLDSVDIDTIDLFYDEYVFSGPEVGVPCPFEVDDSS